MHQNKILSKITVLFAVLMSVWPMATYAQQATTAEANFIFINYIGQEMTFTLDDALYLIPGTDTQPEGGELRLTLSSGMHKFAANLPGGPRGYAGEFSLAAGDTVAKAAHIKQTGPMVDNKGILLEPPQDYVQVFDFDPLAVPIAEIAVVDTWQPTSAALAMGSLVWVNHLGDELTIDLNGLIYKVSAKSGDIPGRLQLDVTPDTYRYTASVPAGSLNGEVVVSPITVIALNVAANPPEPLEYKVGEEFEFVQPVSMKLFSEDVTNQAKVATTLTPDQPNPLDEAPQTLPNTGGDGVLPIVDQPFLGGGVLVKNYAADTLIFTINHQAFVISNNTEQWLILSPGDYTYTASTPAVASNGSVTVVDGQSIILSIAINTTHDFLNVYQN